MLLEIGMCQMMFMDAFVAYGDGRGHARGAKTGQYCPVPALVSSDNVSERNHFASPKYLHGVPASGDIRLELINDLMATSAGCLTWGTPLEVLHTILLFILSPYLSSDDRKVLLSFSKVFRIAYFSPHLYHEWKSICENFVISVKQTMPELLNKPKVHLILHLVDCMVNLGPCSAFSAERDESIYQPGALRKRLSKSPHVLQHVVLNTIGLSCATIEDLHCHDSSTTIELFHCMEDSLVAVFKGLIAADGGLVHAGDFVELLCSETKYALFLTSCQLETGESFCVLQGCDEFVVNSEPVLNEYECPLLAITKRIFSADCSQIKQAVSIVHECSDSCCYQFCIIVAVQVTGLERF
ncbi:hypothetical protein EMCRGX_G002152 [Ephydatia muelleri]